MTDNQSTSYFKVTVGKYYTVSGHTPQKEGVKADIVVPGHWNREEIGEMYADSLESDIIPPAYDDSLKDVPPDLRSWYIKYYIPKLAETDRHLARFVADACVKIVNIGLLTIKIINIS